jgi:glutathione peroxidase-family protein
VAKIDTRTPPAPQLLRTDFADVVGRKPVVITFATPQLCQSRVCGPVVDIVAQTQAKYGDKVAFIHQEVYADNDPNKGVRPQLTAFHLRSEPWTFVIDRQGRVATRFEGAFSSGELERAVAKVAG